MTTETITNYNAASRYQPRFSSEADGGIYAVIVRVDQDGSENVIHGFSRHYRSLKIAEHQADHYITKNNLNG